MCARPQPAFGLIDLAPNAFFCPARRMLILWGGKLETRYAVRQVAATGGTGYELTKDAGTAGSCKRDGKYNVLVSDRGPVADDCDCPGFQSTKARSSRAVGHCKHANACRTLRNLLERAVAELEADAPESPAVTETDLNEMAAWYADEAARIEGYTDAEADALAELAWDRGTYAGAA